MLDVLNQLINRLPSDISKPLHILIILLLAWVALRAIHRFIPHLREAIAMRQGTKEDGQRIRTLSRAIRYVLTVTVSVVAALLVLGEVGISITPILGAAGVVGIAAGFGAQSLVKDYFSGFFLLLENQIRVGDVVEAGGKSGLVEELTLRYLRLRDYSGNVHYIPNGNITVVTNMSSGFAYAVIDVGVAYRERIDRVISIMRTVGRNLRNEQAYVEKIFEDLEIAGVEEWADSAIKIRCRFKVAPLEQWGVRRDFLHRLKEAFDREGIEIPYPHITVIRADAG